MCTQIQKALKAKARSSRRAVKKVDVQEVLTPDPPADSGRPPRRFFIGDINARFRNGLGTVKAAYRKNFRSHRCVERTIAVALHAVFVCHE